jgi:tRNA (mo5U34)-methyltransferase
MARWRSDPTEWEPDPTIVPDGPDHWQLQRDWYHTVDLGGGLVTRGVYDHRQVVDRYGIPESLAGKSALDVGTWDGFWAFELERRGADSVAAVDVARYADFDWLPQVRESLGERADAQGSFQLVKWMTGSKVERHIGSVYDLSPKLGMWDVVFCSDVIQHLFNPLQALISIRSVTREMAIIATLGDDEVEATGKPWMRFGHGNAETSVGKAGIYWRFSTAALEEMLTYAGFSRTEPQGYFTLPPTQVRVTAVVAYP